MVVAESEMNSQNDAESPIELEQQHDVNKNHPFSSLGREASSIYSITLDEFQHTLWESGKNFGSMNMDEFLSSIWCAEETQILNNSSSINISSFSLSEASAEKGLIRKQPSLPRQGSLTLPAPLCRKTVDEVWSEIHKGQQQRQPQKNNDNNCGSVNNDNNTQNTESVRRQPTFGEMTLEDFLIKAGIVREQCAIATPVPASTSQNQHLQQYGFFPNNNRTMDPSFVGRQMMGVGGGGVGGNAGGNVVRPSYQAVPKGGGGGGGGAVGQSSGYPAAVPSAVCFGPRVVNGGGGYEAVRNMGVVAPVSPVSSEGIGTGEKFGCRFGMDKVVSRGRKRVFDGPVEKVVERRQRRMIKNRESAARSRARKLAYTVELEAELTQLKEENAELKLSLADLERRRKQQHSEEGNWRVQNNLEKAKNKSRSLRRTMSCPL